ncbi:MAG: discoidin domain-containing protein [Spirochaetota bacterium]|nr:discoidin domain-containing protein [Spirochaetota bacterium]
MTNITISHKQLFTGTICEFSSQIDNEHTIENVLIDNGYWSSKKSSCLVPEYFIIDYQKLVPINFIQLSTSPSGKTTFPTEFRIETSNDGINWMIIHTETRLDINDSIPYTIDFPLICCKYLKILVLKPKRVGTQFFSEIGRITTGISGIKSISTSSISSYEHNEKKLLDKRNDTYWESGLKDLSNRESIDIDLGRVYHINGIVLASPNCRPHGFSNHFRIQVSSDTNIWTTIIEENNFKAEASRRYLWNIDIIPVRFIHIDMNGMKLENEKYGVRLSVLEIYGVIADHSHTHNLNQLTPYASIFQAGMVKLAKDGDDSPNNAVQGNDSRLKNATTIFKGIVQLAEDGENKEGKAVQASDYRLQSATELRHGISRFARDKEDTPETAVQGNDSRLKEATESDLGIVKICPDGIYSELSVVRGNDTRLQKATTLSYGITRLATNGEDNPECAVQGNDRRLKDASSTHKGIVELAEDGEDRPDVVVQGSDRRLKHATTHSKGIVELAEDGEDRPDVVVQGNDRRLKHATTHSKGIVELAEDGEDRPDVVVQGNDRRLKHATTHSRGIVELAGDGEDRPEVVVQGNDRRLKPATTLTKGIVELAEDGEEKPGVAVQGNDKRLKEATTQSKGIVRIAEDGGDRPETVVQGSDKRLKEATTHSKGIVELAGDGENGANIVVQGNDKRLKDATTVNKGILRFAADGETSPSAAVQGNDKRLREATTTYKGIVQLAEDGENREDVVVQGNDRRLKDATTLSKGIVELAEDGESRPNVVIQGNDSRLKVATEESYGIAKLAKDGDTIKGACVQANDRRLNDPRTPLPHSHSYAPVKHDFNSHTGSISIITTKEERFDGIMPPPDNSAIVYAKNESDQAGAVGIAGISNPITEETKQSYGVIGHSKYVGIRGQSTGNPNSDSMGCGVLGISRFGVGGVFASEHSYSVVADGYCHLSEYDDSLGLMGNGDALLVNGKTEFNGKINLRNSLKDNAFPVNIVEMFEVDNAYYIELGDLLVVSEEGNSILSRSKVSYSTSLVGVVSGNPTVVINNSGKEKMIYPVALAGKVLCRVDARDRAINPGDMIVTSDKPGCGMSGEIDSFSKIGSVIGKALDGIDQGIGIIPIFITHI